MEKVPQIVSERLKVASVPGDHPDPDLLTGFAERSLTAKEQASVLEHLALCTDCREVVALALPESQATHEILRPGKIGWLAWPTLRWGLIAAGVVVIASLGVVEYQHQRSATTNTAYNRDVTKDVRPPQSAVDSLAQPTPAEQVSADKAATATPAAEPKNLPAVTGVAPSAPEPMSPDVASRVRTRAIGAPLPGGPRVQWQQNTQQLYQSPAARPQQATALNANPVASAAAQPSAASDVPNTAKETVEASTQMPAVEPSPQSSTDARVVRTKPAMAAAALSAHEENVGGVKAISQVSFVSWRVGDAGQLQHSFDQGTSWQDVNVQNFGQSSAFALAKSAPRAERAATNSLKKEVSAPLFRAVSANGAEVWAGASNALLYHSTDGGYSWTQVVPSASGVALTGDILSLEFVDQQHGRIITSTPETWMTSDAGQTWQRQ